MKVEFTKNYLKECLLSHPEPYSILAISDTLEKYKIESLAVKLTLDSLNQLPLPLIVQMKGDNFPYFSCVTMFNNEEVRLLNENGNPTVLLRKEFETSWTGVTLVCEKTEKSEEPGINLRKTRDFDVRFLQLSLGILIVISVILNISDLESISEALVAYSLIVLKISGLLLASILLWSEVDKDNSAINKFCSGGGNVDCDKVTNSFSLRGSISLSLLAFAYFISGFFILIFTSFSASGIELLNCLSLSGLVIIPISLYYQKVKIGKWCKLCLWILVVLSGELLLILLNGKSQDPIILNHFIYFVILFLGSILIWLVLKPYIISKNENFTLKNKITKIYSDKEVFNYFISKSKRLTHTPEGLGILMKGKSPKYHVLKVCNPYCGPCSNSHPILEELYETGKIDLQIIFALQTNDLKKLDIIRHLLAIDSLGNQKLTQKALDNWYLADEKDYKIFASKFPINGDLHNQENKIQEMLKWSEHENIRHTPTFFINGFELPENYTIEDLKYLLQ